MNIVCYYYYILLPPLFEFAFVSLLCLAGDNLVVHRICHVCPYKPITNDGNIVNGGGSGNTVLPNDLGHLFAQLVPNCNL